MKTSAIVSLTEKFISIKSNPDNAQALEDILELALAQVSEYTVERFERDGAKSALVYNTKKRPKKFTVILNGHLDVIPGKEQQYTPRIKNGKIYGVGAMDMKASVACLIAAFSEVACNVTYPLGLQLVTDEEIGGFNGTKYQIEKGVRSDFVIVGEDTHFDIENKAKGIVWAKISTRGKSAHGAYPWKGENAIRKMNSFLSALCDRYPDPKKEQWATTVNVAHIETRNNTFNKIPDYCEVWLDIRFIPEESKTIIGTIKKLLPKDFTTDIIANEPALSTDENNMHLIALKQSIRKVIGKHPLILSANGSSDARHFARVGCSAIEFGPGGGGMGSDSEWINISDLKKYTAALTHFLLSL